MATTTIIWLVTLGVKLLAALVGLFVACAKFVDWRRQKKGAVNPPLAASLHEDQQYATRAAPCMASESREPVTRYHHIADDLHTGDLFLFSGRALHSYLIRIPTWSRMSHCGMIYRDHGGKVLVAEVVERLKLRRNGWRFSIDKGGFNLTPLIDYVRKNPGQCYVAKVATEYDRPDKFNRTAARSAIDASANWSYGWLGIAFQLLTKLPLLREIAYLATWKNIDRAWDKRFPPFCSWADSIWATIAGQDPTPCLAPQLTTPAEIERSKLWGRKVALVP
jgi:hypothetical protein